jgi:hypothetical protein
MVDSLCQARESGNSENPMVLNLSYLDFAKSPPGGELMGSSLTEKTRKTS